MAAAPVPWPPASKFSNTVRFSAYDIASAEDTLVQPNTMADLSTGLAMTLPEGSRMFTAPRFGERLPDGVDALPREIESYELCDVPIVFWNRSPNSYQGTPNFWLILLFAIYFSLFSSQGWSSDLRAGARSWRSIRLQLCAGTCASCGVHVVE